MRFEYIVLLIIAFNVVTAVMKSRAKKAKARVPEANRNAERPVAEMPGLGRDILDQLARDLGLRLPVPGPSLPVPAEASTPEPVMERREESLREQERQKEKAVVKAQEKRMLQAEAAQTKARSEPSRSRTGIGASPLRNSLLGQDRLREAFILKEILDLPLARRGQGGRRS